MERKIESNELINDIKDLPLLPSRGLVILPGMSVNFDVGRKNSIKAIEAAMRDDQRLIVASQLDIAENNPGTDGIFTVGTSVIIKQFLKISDDTVRILVKAKNRVQITKLETSKGYFNASFFELNDMVPKITVPKNEAMLRMLRELFDEYCAYIPKPAVGIVVEMLKIKDLGKLADFIAANSFLGFEQKQEILEELNPINRAELVVDFLHCEIEILKIEQDIAGKVRDQIDNTQREYYLKEQMKVIQGELGDTDLLEGIDEYEEKIELLATTDEVKEKLLKDLDRLAKMPPMSHEGSVIRTYLDLVLEMPFGKKTKDTLDIHKAKKILDRDHYGIDKVKERIIEQIAVRCLCEAKGQILCLVGAPGVGKTSVARSIAAAMNRRYSRISLGGIRDEAEIRGHRRTYIGAMPGRIAAAVRQAKSSNPVILLDEIDKMCADFRGDSSAALLEALDPEQNVNFVDHYLDIPFDLSDVFFIATANTTDSIPRPLLDRMEVIELSSYLDTEKLQISKNFLIPKQRKKHGLKGGQIKISDAAVKAVISGYTRESGVRELERCFAKIMRRAAMKIVGGELRSLNVTEKNLNDLLGIVKYTDEVLYDQSATGIANGLAWTSVGGEMLNIEVSVMEGSGKLELTGSLGEVMKESARAAISYVRFVSEIYNIEPTFYKTKDIHIHFPEGAVPKDGPSAGITVATALFSALSLIPVNNKVAMTGEITLTGRVLAIGGLKEKTMAAYKNGIKKVLIPHSNLPNLQEIDNTVLANIEFVPVKNMSEVLEHALKYPIREGIPKPKPLSIDNCPAADNATIVYN